MQTTDPVAERGQGVDAPKPQILGQCHEVIDTLARLLGEQQREIAYLHKRVTLNSKMSSKPVTPRRALLQRASQTPCRRTAATCSQLIKSWASLWRFLHHADVAPIVHDDAERARRAIVVQRKISGPARSRRGDIFIAQRFWVIDICRRRDRDAFE